MNRFRAAARQLLDNRDLRFLLGAQYVAQAADGMAQAVFADVLVLEPLAQGTPDRILGLFALTLLPYSALAPFLGVFVDRWRRRSVLIRTNAVRAVLLITLPLWSRLFEGYVALAVALLALLGLGRLFLTTKGAVLPVVLHEHHLLRGNAISSGGGMIAALTGGVVGVVTVRSLLSPGASFAMAGGLYAASALVITRIGNPLAHDRSHAETLTEAIARVARELRDGLREIYSRPRARIPLAGIFVLRMIVMFVAIAAILLIKQRFPEAGEDFGRRALSATALGAAGVGAFAGAVTAPLLGARFTRGALVLLGYGFSGIAILLLGGVDAVPALLALTAIGGYGGFVAKVAVDALVQRAIPDTFRGRAFALYDVLYNLASVAAALLMVAVFGRYSLRATMMSVAVFSLGLALLLGSAMKRAGMLGWGAAEAADEDPVATSTTPAI